MKPHRKDIHLSVSLDAEVAEMLDVIRTLENISHAEAVRRAVRNLHGQVTRPAGVQVDGRAGVAR